MERIGEVLKNAAANSPQTRSAAPYEAPSNDSNQAKPSSTSAISRALGALALTLGVMLSEDRVAALSVVLVRLDMSPVELEAVVSRLLYDETLAEGLRYGATITPADFQRALSEVRGLSERRETLRQNYLAQAKAEQDMASRGIKHYTEVRRVESKVDNLKRLAGGHGNPHPGDDDYAVSWSAYYGRRYVKDAREQARALLEGYEENDAPEPA